MRTSKLLSIAAAALVVAACGSDKKEDRLPNINVAYTGPQTSATISGADVGGFAVTAKTAAEGLSGATAGASGSASLFGVASSSASFGVLKAMRYAAAYRGGAALTGVAMEGSWSGPCEGGGSMTISFYDPDGIPTVTGAGTSFGMSFDECTDAEGTSNDGSFSLTITSAPPDANAYDPASLGTGTWTFGYELRFGNLVTWTPDGSFAGTNGDIAFDFIVDGTALTQTFAISGTSLAGVAGTGGTVVDAFRLSQHTGGDGKYHETFTTTFTDASMYTVEQTSWGFSGRICSTDIGGCLDLSISPAFAQLAGDVYPYQGTYRIDADNGAFIEIVATDGATGAISVTYDLDGNGGQAAFGPYATTWYCLESEPDSTACFQ